MADGQGVGAGSIIRTHHLTKSPTMHNFDFYNPTHILFGQGRTPESIGTLPTHRPQFIGMVAGVTLILVALTFLPMLALGPLAEGIH